MKRNQKAICALFFALTVFFSVTIVLQTMAVWPPPEFGIDPPSFSNVQHTVDNFTAVTVTWNVDFDPLSEANWMTFYWRPVGGSWTGLQTWNPAYSQGYSRTISGLDPGTYEYKITAWSRDFIEDVYTTTTGPHSVDCSPISITNVQATQRPAPEDYIVDYSWDINWDPSLTNHSVSFYFSNISTLTENDIIQTWNIDNSTFDYSYPVPYFGTFWYQIKAEAINSTEVIQTETSVAEIQVNLLQPSNEDVLVFEDAHVKQSHPNTNYNGESLIVADELPDPFEIQQIQTYVKFDLRGVFDVTSAELTLYVQGVSGTPEDIHCKGVTSNWFESNLTWNNRPSSFQTSEDSIIPIVGQWVTWDVTSWLQSHEDRVVAFVLYTMSYQTITFTAKEGGDYPISGNIPYLHVEGNYRAHHWEAYDYTYSNSTPVPPNPMNPLPPNYPLDPPIYPGFIVPLYTLYNPPGDQSYQRITHSEEMNFDLSFSVCAEVGVGGFMGGISGEIDVKWMAGVSFSAKQSVTTATSSDLSLYPELLADAGGDTIVGLRYTADILGFGVTRVSNEGSISTVYHVIFENVQYQGEFQGFRGFSNMWRMFVVDESADPNFIELEDLRGVEGPYTYPSNDGNYFLDPCQDFDFVITRSLSAGYKIKQSFNFELKFPVKVKIKLGFEMEVQSESTFETEVHIEDSYRGIAFNINSWSSILLNEGLPRFGFQVNDWIYWFNSEYYTYF